MGPGGGCVGGLGLGLGFITASTTKDLSIWTRKNILSGFFLVSVTFFGSWTLVFELFGGSFSF